MKKILTVGFLNKKNLTVGFFKYELKCESMKCEVGAAA